MNDTVSVFMSIPGEAIPIYAEIENHSSRLVMPKAVIYQIQTYKARGKTISYKQVVANVRGNHIPSGCSVTWSGKTLKIPPVSPSILNSDILRVEYSLAVSAMSIYLLIGLNVHNRPFQTTNLLLIVKEF